MVWLGRGQAMILADDPQGSDAGRQQQLMACGGALVEVLTSGACWPTGSACSGKLRMQRRVRLRGGAQGEFGVNTVRFNERYKRAHTLQKEPSRKVFKRPVAVAPRQQKTPVATKAEPILLTAEEEPIQLTLAEEPSQPPKTVVPAPAPPAVATCPVCQGRDFVTATGTRRCKNCFTVVP